MLKRIRRELEVAVPGLEKFDDVTYASEEVRSDMSLPNGIVPGSLLKPLIGQRFETQFVRFYRVHGGDLVPENHPAGMIYCELTSAELIVEMRRILGSNNHRDWHATRLYHLVRE